MVIKRDSDVKKNQVMGAAEHRRADRPCKSMARLDDMTISLLYAVNLPKVACCSGDIE